MKNVDRAAKYAESFPDYPPLATHGEWLYGMWEIGANYKRTNNLYGAYPPSYLRRVHSLFPDARNVLHLFSGGLTMETAMRAASWDPVTALFDKTPLQESMELVDIKGPEDGRYPTWQGSAHNLPEVWDDRFDLVLADPPYSTADAEKYGLPSAPNTRKVMEQLHRVTKLGGNLVWLDQKRPMFRKVDWRLWGAIGLVRSTNHRVRLVSIFEKR